MNNNFLNNVKLLSGDKALENLPFEIVANGAKRPLLVCDEISNRLGYLRDLYKVFNNNDIVFGVVINNIADTPTVGDCERIAKLFRSGDCDSIVAIGRYAAISVAKCVKLLIKDGGNFMSAYKNQEVSGYSLMNIPLFVVPTGLGCGFETSNKIRISDDKSNAIYEINCNFAQTSVVVCDGRMVDVMPTKLIVDTGLSCYARAIVGHILSGENFVAKTYLESGLRLLKENFFPCLMKNANKKLSLQLLTANVIVGIGNEAATPTMLDRLSYVLSDRYDVSIDKMYLSLFPHYLFNSNFLELDLTEVLLYLVGEEEYSMTTPKGRLQKFESVVRELYNKVGVLVDFDIKLSSIGVQNDDVDGIVDNYVACYGDNEEKIREKIGTLLLKCV